MRRGILAAFSAVFCLCNMENEKNFDDWNEKKKMIESSSDLPVFRVGQIWWAKIGLNIASEINGKGKDFLRPVVIIQKMYGDACLVIPLTSSEKSGDYYYFFKDSKARMQYACLTQTRYLDGKRLKRKFSFIKIDIVKELREAVCALIKK